LFACVVFAVASDAAVRAELQAVSALSPQPSEQVFVAPIADQASIRQ
jgi:hypothetical protein